MIQHIRIFLLQQYEERIEKLSQQDRLSKFCMDAGFLSVVENGQYFMTKDTGDLTQFNTVACREYTLPREESTSRPKGWIQGNTKIGPVMEVTISYLHGKHGVEIRIMSVNEDNSHSWVTISHGSIKLVTNLNSSEQETSEVQFKEYALKVDARDFACRSKAKAKPQRREPAGYSTRTIPTGKRTWTDVEPGEYSFSDYAVSKKLIHLLRHGRLPQEKTMERLNSGESKTIFKNSSCIVIIGLTTSGRKAWQEEEETRKDFSIVLIHQEQSCTSELFKSIQDTASLILLYRTM